MQILCSLRHLVWLPLKALVVILACQLPGMALPQGGQVTQGSATIQQVNDTKLNINQSTDRAVINWNSFSIAPQEWVNFQQPSSTSATLNRVTGSTPSSIAGRLTANGQVFLVNPNGIAFLPTAQVDVAGLVASTLNIKDSDFMQGILRFEQVPGKPPASVVNQGLITVKEAGFAALVAPAVQNSGVISARLGKVVLASGTTVSLDFYGDGLLSVTVDPKLAGEITDIYGNKLNSLVDNQGNITAPGGVVVLTAQAAGQVVNNVINTGGIIEAKYAENRNGVIVLSGGSQGTVAVNGTLDVSGEKGGKVEITGEKIALNGNALVDASGNTGGGIINIGGSFQGKGTLQNAIETTVAKDVQIKADAITQGNGGEVIVWADGTTKFAGFISAKGGELSGNGGFAEVSGRGSLFYDGLADLRAPQGKTGTLLLDPKNILIQPSFASSPLPGLAFSDDPTGDITITTASLISALTSANVTLQANNDILADFPFIGFSTVTSANGNTLTLQAGRSINFSLAFSQPDLNIVLIANEANANGVIAANRDPGPAFITFGNTSFISNITSLKATIGVGGGRTGTAAETGNITLNKITAPNGITATNNGLTAGSSIIVNGALNSTSGPIKLTSPNNININSTINTGGNITLKAGDTVTQSQAITANGLELLGSGEFILTNASNDINILAGNTTNNITYVDNNSLTVATVNSTTGIETSGNITVVSGGTLTVAAGISGINSTGGTTTLKATTDILLGTSSNFGDVRGQKLVLNAGQDIIIDNNTFAQGDGSGGVDVFAGRDFKIVSAIATGSLLNSNGGGAPINIKVGGTFTLDTGTTSGIAANGGNITITADQMALTSGTIGSTGLLFLQPLNTATTIGIGTGATGTLNLDTAEIGRLVDGFSQIIIGRTDGTGNIEIKTAQFKDNVIIRTPVGTGTINLKGALSTGSGTETGTISLLAGESIIGTNTGSITTQGKAVILHSDFDATNGGAIKLTGTTITSNGGNIVLGGGLNPLNDPAIGTTTLIRGIELDGGILTAGAGSISLRGKGFNSGGNNYGIYQLNGSQVSTTTGNITYIGTGGDAVNDNYGVFLKDANTKITATSGKISITGTGQGSGVLNIGILQIDGAQVSTTSGNITYLGSGKGTATNYGVSLGNPNTKITSGSGIISITGTSQGTTGSSNNGILQANGGQVFTTSGNINYKGTGDNGAAAILIQVGTNIIGNNTTGVISFTSTNNAITLNNVEVKTTNNILITSPDKVTQNNNNGLFANGLELTGAGAYTLTNPNNDISILAGNTSNSIKYTDTNGFDIGTVNSTNGVNVGGNNLTLTAGGTVTQSQTITANGLELLGSGAFTLTNTSNDISTLAGNTTNNIKYTDTNGFDIASVNTTNGVNVTASKNLTLTAGDSVTQSQKIIANGLELLGAGAYTLTNSSNNINTLAGNTTNSIKYTDADSVKVGTVNTIGLKSGQKIIINSISGDVTLVSNTPITSTAGSITLQAGRNIIGNTGSSITTQGKNITLNSDRDATNGGAIQLTGTTITSNGGDIILGGGADPTLDPAIGVLGFNSGILLNGTKLNAGAGDISLIGQGRNTVAANSHGISIINNSSLTTTSGDIELIGDGGDRLLGIIDNNSGINIADSKIQSDSGEISLEGNGGSSPIGANNAGIILTNSFVINTDGDIWISGEAGNALLGTLNNNTGIVVSGSTINNQRGNIELSGIGGNSLFGASNIGISIINKSVINNTDGAIFLKGVGGASLTNLITNNDGVNISQSTIINSTGIVEIIGIGGNSLLGKNNVGLRLIDSNLSSDKGAINLAGAGGLSLKGNTGILQNNTTVKTTSGNIFYDAEGTGSAIGLIVNNTSTIGEGTSGDIELVSAAMELGGTISGQRVLLQQPLTANPLTDFVVQTGGSIQANQLSLEGFSFILDQSKNNTVFLIGSADIRIQYTDNDGFKILGLETPTAILTAGGLITQSAPITVTNLAILGTGDTELTNPNNAIKQIAANTTGNLKVSTKGTLTVDTVNPDGIENSQSTFLQSLDGDIVLNKSVNATGGITLVADGNFINNVGTGALNTKGIFLVYATSPAGNVNGWPVLGGSQQFNTVYPQPALFSGSGFLYKSLAPIIPGLPSSPVFSEPVTFVLNFNEQQWLNLSDLGNTTLFPESLLCVNVPVNQTSETPPLTDPIIVQSENLPNRRTQWQTGEFPACSSSD